MNYIKLIITVLFFTTFLCSTNTYFSECDFLKYYDNKGYKCIGLYSEGWPARIIPEETYSNQVVVSNKINGVIVYKGFEDLDFKIVVLKTKKGNKNVVGLISDKYFSNSNDSIKYLTYNDLIKIEIKKVDIISYKSKGDIDTVITMPIECFKNLIRQVKYVENAHNKKIKEPRCVGFKEFIINDKYVIKAGCLFRESPCNEILYLKGFESLVSYNVHYNDTIDCFSNIKRKYPCSNY